MKGAAAQARQVRSCLTTTHPNRVNTKHPHRAYQGHYGCEWRASQASDTASSNSTMEPFGAQLISSNSYTNRRADIHITINGGLAHVCRLRPRPSAGRDKTRTKKRARRSACAGVAEWQALQTWNLSWLPPAGVQIPPSASGAVASGGFGLPAQTLKITASTRSP
jgi:hypothetical protein